MSCKSSRARYRFRVAWMRMLLAALAAISLPAQSGDPKALYDQGVAAGAAGKFAEARGLLRQALAAGPGNPAVVTCLSFAEDGAEGRLPAEAGKLLFASTASGNRQDWSGALSSAQKATELAGKYAPAHMHLGVVYAQLAGSGKGEQYSKDAIGAYRKAVEIKPDYALAHFNLGVAYGATKQSEMAREELQRAKQLAQSQGDAVLPQHCDRVLSQISSQGTKSIENSVLTFLAGLWPFGPGGLICQHILPSAYTQMEQNFWRNVGGCRPRR